MYADITPTAPTAPINRIQHTEEEGSFTLTYTWLYVHSNILLDMLTRVKERDYCLLLTLDQSDTVIILVVTVYLVYAWHNQH